MSMSEQLKRTAFVGSVISDRMDKTIVVAVSSSHVHPFFKKVVRSVKKYKVHDPREEAAVGDVVEIHEGRPLSKTKYMYLTRVVKQAAAA